MNHRGRHPDLLLTIAGSGDRAIWADQQATVGDLVNALDGDRMSTIVVQRTGQALPPAFQLDAVDLRYGDTIELQTGFDGGDSEVDVDSVIVRILTGTQAGDEVPLKAAETRIGRAADNQLVLIDPGVSRYHASIVVDSSSVTVSDSGSTNGVLINNHRIDGPIRVRSGDRVLIGRTWLQIVYSSPGVGSDPVDTSVVVTPGFRPLKRYSGGLINFPQAPSKGGLLRRPGSSYNAAVSLFERSLQTATAELVKEIDTEWSARLGEAPAVQEVAEAVAHDQSRLWPRASHDPLLARIGLATLPSRIYCVVPPGGEEEHRARSEAVVAQHEYIEGVPVTVDFGAAHSVLIAGDEERSRLLAYAMLAQLAAQHSPGRLRVWGMLSPDHVGDWEWLKWLPHCSGDDGAGTFGQITADAGEYEAMIQRLVSSVNRSVDQVVAPPPVSSSPPSEGLADGAGDHKAPVVPLSGPVDELLVIDARAEIANQLQVIIGSLATQSDVRLSVLVVGPCDPHERLDLPFGTEGSVVVVDGDYASLEARGAQMTDATLGIKHETYALSDVAALAKGMSSARVHGGAAGGDRRSQDATAGGLADLVPEGEPDVVVQRWLSHANQGRLMASIGTNANGAVRVDLRELGPHALVRGEVDGFIPAWLTALAAGYSPNDVNFYLVDSGADGLFQICRNLPHTIGGLSNPTVLDLKSALAQLSAEMDRRQEVLASLGCDSLAVLERQAQASPFPYLVVAVDRVDELGRPTVRATGEVISLDAPTELLALAERGQELGVHLLLGAEEGEELRSQIPLRITARRSGASTMSVGQAPPILFSATLAPPRPEIVVAPFEVGVAGPAAERGGNRIRTALPVVGDDDLERLVGLIRRAHESSGNPLPSMLS